MRQPDLLQGSTTLFLLDLPVIGDEAPSAPLLVAAAAGAADSWRRAVLSTSLNDGGWASQGSTAAPAVAGYSRSILQPAGSALMDLTGAVEVELLSAAMWLESRSDPALANGANAAMLGNELIQFGSAEPLGGRRFRLSRLLRGRRGTEWAAATHVSGEPFVLLERDRLAPVEAPAGSIGGELKVMAAGVGDADAPSVAALTIEGRALQPPSPVHLRAEREASGDIAISWVRRSRSGWAWLSGSDTPLGEERESYRLVLSGAGFERTINISHPGYIYTAAQQAEDGWAGPLLIRVVQVGTYALSRAAKLFFG